MAMIENGKRLIKIDSIREQLSITMVPPIIIFLFVFFISYEFWNVKKDK